jgi:hypothetical protein
VGYGSLKSLKGGWRLSLVRINQLKPLVRLCSIPVTYITIRMIGQRRRGSNNRLVHCSKGCSLDRDTIVVTNDETVKGI